MSLSVLQRPKGVALGSAVTSFIEQDYIGYATVKTTSPHNLATNDWVYIVSVVENYNGFWQIHFIDGYHYFLLNPDGTYVAYIVDTSITYYPYSFTHGWSCVELPIMYQLSNTRFPTNSVDTARTVSSFSNSNGYVQLTLSGSLGTFEDLSFVKISGTSLLDDVYQIFDKWSTSSIVINLAYASALSFSGGTVQLYYSNYHVSVKLYAGLNSSHTWASVKPYELAATLDFIPDENNKVTFSVNEILMFYIEQRNNLLLATLPNNLDFWTQFYISYSESYDTSDGYTITTHQDAYTSDQSTFEGYAANSKLEFKNIYSGYLTQYIMNRATFLTLFSIPVLFGCSDNLPNCYQDISFINNYSNAVRLRFKQEYYSNNILQTTTTTNIENYSGVGLYRLPLSPNCLYSRVDISVIADLSGAAEESTFGQFSTGVGQSSISNGAGSVDATGVLKSSLITPGQLSEVGYVAFDAPPGTYNVGGTSDVSVTSGTPISQVRYVLLDRFLNILATSSYHLITSGSPDSYNDNLTSSTARIAYVGLQYQFTSGTGSFDINGTLKVGFTTGYQALDVQISETKQIEVNCGCSNQEIRLSWVNNLGGFDYWNFTAFSEYIRNITDSGTTSTDPFANWPKSYGADANTLTKQSYRDSQKQILVRSQHVTQAQMDAIMFIKSSVLVEIVNSRMDKRRVILDTDSFTAYKDNDKLYNISFTLSYTDDIPSQRI